MTDETTNLRGTEEARGRRRRVPRLSLWIALALLAVVLAWWTPGSTEEPGYAVVQRGDLVLGVEITGTLEASESTLLGPPPVDRIWNFKLAMLVPEGTEVEAGTPVMAFDTSELQRNLRDKIAERDSAEQEIEKERTSQERELRDLELRLAEARAELRKARLKVDVPEELQEANKLQQARIDLKLAEREVRHVEEEIAYHRLQTESRLRTLREKRDRAASRVEEIERQIREMTVRAPRDGTVIYVTDPRRGREKKKVGDQVWKMEKVLEIPDLASLRAEGEVDEADAGQITEGLPVSLRLDAHPDITYRGTVRRIHHTVQRTSPALPVKVVRLEIDLEESDPERMRPGMRFRGEVELERHEGVVLAPHEAVFNTPEGPEAWVDGWLGPKRVRPRLGRRSDDQVEILAGLEPGDRLLTSPPEDP